MKEVDEVTLTIILTRNENGTVRTKTKLTGEGFMFFEIIGVIESIKHNYIIQSTETAKKLPKDKKVRNKFV